MPAMKRPAAAVPGQAAKSLKKATETPKAASPAAAGPEVPRRTAPKGPVAQVIKGLAASDLPQSARDMLADMLVVSLSVCNEDRDKYQSKVVEMVDVVLSAVDEALQRKVEEMETLISEDVHSKEDLESKFAGKGRQVESKQGEVLTKKQELADVARSFKLARQTAQEAEVQDRNVESEAKSKVDEREMLANLREALLGPFEDAKADNLIQRLTSLAINDSMMVALPAVLAKSPSERGSFDAMVLTSVCEELDRRIAAADEVIQNVEPTKASKAEALRQAQATLKEFAKKQVDRAAAYREVHGQEEELDKEAAELQLALRKLKETSRKHGSTSATAKSKLEQFKQGPKHAFEALRDAIAEVPQVEATIEKGEVETGEDQTGMS